MPRHLCIETSKQVLCDHFPVDQCLCSCSLVVHRHSNFDVVPVSDELSHTSAHFQQLLREQGITCSMSRAGEVWDNSAMESFFSSMKTERTARKVYRRRGQARADVFDYIERFYNPTRRHSTLGYLSPVQFEQAQEA